MTGFDLSDSDYRALGEFRRRLRRFLHFSEAAALAEGLEPRQHQLMLEVRADGEAEGVTVGQLAERLLVRPHSAAELLDRLERKGLVIRVRGGGDGRQVRIRLTRKGEGKLKRLSIAHRAELRQAAPELVAALRELMANPLYSGAGDRFASSASCGAAGRPQKPMVRPTEPKGR